jgi:hypothetical protein
MISKEKFIQFVKPGHVGQAADFAKVALAALNGIK